MARLTWDAENERAYENGIDRGALYVPGEPGVPWNGLTSVTERPSGGEPQPFYLDGVKFANFSAAEEFELTIEAFSAPREFAVCEGVSALHTGLFAAQQPRKHFGFAYRTLIGNGIEELGLGYKLHLVYNALASPSERKADTLGEGISPMTMSWDITSTPEKLSNIKPTAHFIIDSTTANKALLGYLEAALYGTNEITPMLPTPEKLVEIFGTDISDVSAPVTVIGEMVDSAFGIKNLATNPSFEATSGTVEVRRNLALDPRSTSTSGFSTISGATIAVSTTETHDGLNSIQVTTPATANAGYAAQTSLAATVGMEAVGGAWVKAPLGFEFYAYTRAGNSGLDNGSGTYYTGTGAWEWITATPGVNTSGEGNVHMLIRQSAATAAVFYVAQPLIELGSGPLSSDSYFDGSTPPKVRRNLFIEPTPATAAMWPVARFGRTFVTDPDGDYVRGTTNALGTSYFNLTTTPARVPVAPGDVVTYSADFRTGAGADNGYIRLYWHDSAGAIIPGHTDGPLVSGDWSRAHVTGTAPAGAASVGAYFLLGGTSPVGATLDVRRVMAERAAAPGDYFDGSTGAPQGFATAWEGTPNASASYLYDADFTPSWTGAGNASESVLTGEKIAGTSVAIQSARWYLSGSHSLRAQKTTDMSVNLSVGLPLEVGKTYTMLASIHTEKALGSGNQWGVRFIGGTPGALYYDLPTTPGVSELRMTFTVPPGTTLTYPRLLIPGEDIVWLDNLLVIEGDYTGPYFDGDSEPFVYNNQLVIPKWNGTAHASTSEISIQEDLPNTALPGTAYLINGEMWVFDNGAWINLGEVPTLT